MTMVKKKILMVGFFDVLKHKRLTRQVAFFKDDFEITVAGFFEGELLDGVRCIPIPPRFRRMSLADKAVTALLILLGQFDGVYDRLYDPASAIHHLGNQNFDLIIAHDFKPLPLLKRLGGKAPVIINAHEYHFDMGTDSFFIHRFNTYLLENYFLDYEHYYTVCQGIADEYLKNFGKRFQVVTNAHEFVDLQPVPMARDKIRLIYHGLAHPARKLEILIEMMDLVDHRFELDLMLTTLFDSGSYGERLKEMCNSRPNVRIIEPVHPNEIVSFCNRYDIGIFVWPATNINFKYIFPNKFFEYIQSRLMICTGPSIEVQKVVEEYDIGVVSPDFTVASMADILNDLTFEQVKTFKERVHVHARQLSCETQMKKLAQIIEPLLAGPESNQ